MVQRHGKILKIFGLILLKMGNPQPLLDSLIHDISGDKWVCVIRYYANFKWLLGFATAFYGVGLEQLVGYGVYVCVRSVRWRSWRQGMQESVARAPTSSRPERQVRERWANHDEVLRRLQAAQMLRPDRDDHRAGQVQMSRSTGSCRGAHDDDQSVQMLPSQRLSIPLIRTRSHAFINLRGRRNRTMGAGGAPRCYPCISNLNAMCIGYRNIGRPGASVHSPSPTHSLGTLCLQLSVT